MKLNQIHTRENNLLNVSGTAHIDAKIEVSGRNVLAARQGRYWSDALTVGNVLRPWRGPLTIFAAQQNGGPGGTTDLVRTDVRLAQLPQALQTFEYDDDGNLTTDGVWDYVWDAENRIVRMTTTTLAVLGGYPNRRLEFKYDYLGRRVQKRVSDHASNQLVSAARFIYEGWNMIGEYTDTGATLPGTIKRSYTWGLDIVHTREKAGGVGALLQIADYVGSKGYFPAYDGNGNVVALFDGAPSGGSAGARVAAYEYSPFGELLRSEGSYAAENPVRFSTKFTDDESSLVYYGRRYYSPSHGRFLGRDPIEEAGGLNLYGFVRNNPTNAWDLLGMTPAATITTTIRDPNGNIASQQTMYYRDGVHGWGYYSTPTALYGWDDPQGSNYGNDGGDFLGDNMATIGVDNQPLSNTIEPNNKQLSKSECDSLASKIGNNVATLDRIASTQGENLNGGAVNSLRSMWDAVGYPAELTGYAEGIYENGYRMAKTLLDASGNSSWRKSITGAYKSAAPTVKVVGGVLTAMDVVQLGVDINDRDGLMFISHSAEMGLGLMQLTPGMNLVVMGSRYAIRDQLGKLQGDVDRMDATGAAAYNQEMSRNVVIGTRNVNQWQKEWNDGGCARFNK